MDTIVTRGNKVVFREDNTIVKLYNDTKPVSDIFNEALNLSRAHEAGIRTSEVVSVAKRDGGWALTTSLIGGPSLKDLILAEPEKTDKYLRMFVDFQMEIHTFRAPLMQRQKDKYARMIKSVSDLIDATTRYELEMRLDGMPDTAEVCHGDYTPSNVIVSPTDGQLYAVDWAHATQGSGAADAAISYLLFEIHSHEMATKYLDMYCKKSDTPKQVVRAWLPIIAAAELSRRREQGKDFLMSWVDVVDYQ